MFHSPRLGCTMNSHQTNYSFLSSIHLSEKTVSDRYRGVILYVKNTLSYFRRHDLEPNGLECIWIQIKSKNTRNILYGEFYIPPNSDSAYYTLIEDSISLAMDSNISDVIITGDFNLNVMKQHEFRKRKLQ